MHCLSWVLSLVFAVRFLTLPRATEDLANKIFDESENPQVLQQKLGEASRQQLGESSKSRRRPPTEEQEAVTRLRQLQQGRPPSPPHGSSGVSTGPFTFIMCLWAVGRGP